ncbi:alcohol dehydrogenase catalytic domain-containing protein [uncultured Microbacterium sp.]|uniref:alcohol dehydrogenase catalytic domain-containing protein n=1 Tax=uncultured Microbacterium sp. TaxID=191216 RepID=UPI0028DCD6E9|nr:alcohol dehydrogenase catalytic domain-containing protein [uncultured Microbacterium sp.]
MLTRPPGHRRDVVLRPAATAMVLLAAGHPHETIAVPGVALGEEDVLVAVELSTVCRADAEAARGARRASTPVVLGHESVGRIIALGDAGATAFDGSPLRIGDRVVWSATVSCRQCDRCLCGRPQSCPSATRYGEERVAPDRELAGAFASHVQLRPGTAVVRVPETLPAAVLAPAACTTATAWAAVARVRRHRDLVGTRVRVHGAGLLGLTVTAMAVGLGAVVEVRDPDAGRRARAREFGATTVDGEPDAVVHTAGPVTAAAIEAVADGGIVIIVGGDARDTDPVAAASAADRAVGAGASDAGATGLENVGIDAARLSARSTTIAGVHGSAGGDLADAVAFLAGRGRAYPFADAVGSILALSAVDAALAAASEPAAPLRVGLVPGP